MTLEAGRRTSLFSPQALAAWPSFSSSFVMASSEVTRLKVSDIGARMAEVGARFQRKRTNCGAARAT